MAFIPHTAADVAAMLAAIGVASIEDLFDEIPPQLRVQVARGRSRGAERDAGRAAHERARARRWRAAVLHRRRRLRAPHPRGGLGDHDARGVLQRLHALPGRGEPGHAAADLRIPDDDRAASPACRSPNASLYDGASACAEASLMAVRANRKSKSARILVPDDRASALPQAWRVATAGNQGLRFEEVPYTAGDGCHGGGCAARYEGEDITALVIQQPNFFGALEDVDALTDWAHARGILVIAVVNPTSLALLKPPGQWGTRGADIAVGDGQPLGVPLSSGGPYFGFMTTRMEYRAADARAHRRAHARCHRQAGLYADPAGARAAHPPRQGDFQHLHQPGAADDRGDDLHVADGAAGSGAHRRGLARAHRGSWWPR